MATFVLGVCCTPFDPVLWRRGGILSFVELHLRFERDLDSSTRNEGHCMESEIEEGCLLVSNS